MTTQKNNPPSRELFSLNIQPDKLPSQPFEAALHYRRNGFCPIPVGIDKEPHISWKKYQTQLPTNEEIKEWWVQYPNANVALIGGHGGLVVLDIDVKGHPAGRQKLADTIANALMKYATVVRTPSGGYHIYFLEPDAQSRSGQLANIGDLQGAKRYVLAPPTLGYELLNDKKPLGIPTVSIREYLEDFLPQFGVDIRQELKYQVPSPTVTTGEISKGTRNNTLTSLGGYLRLRGLSEQTIYAALLAINQSACSPPLPTLDVRSIAASIGQYPAGQRLPFHKRDFWNRASALSDTNSHNSNNYPPGYAAQ